MDFKEYIENRFGITFPEFLIIEELSNGRVRAYNKEVESLIEVGEVYNKGMSIGRKYKPSTDFLQAFGFLCTRNIVILNREEAESFLKGKAIEIKNELKATDGYVCVFYRGKAIGCGLLKGNMLFSEIPKYKRIVDIY